MAASTADQPPRVEVAHFTPDVTPIGGGRVLVRGLLENHGPGSARVTAVRLTVHPRDGSGPFDGIGLPVAEVLGYGETLPFQVSAPFCCPDDVERYAFDVTSSAAEADRYRALVTTGVVARDVDGGRLYGDLRNDGAAYARAGATALHVGFWRGEALVDLRAAVLPVTQTPGQPGQAFPPGYRLPWWVERSPVEHDRVALWPVTERFPDGVYPVPLGVRDVVARPAADGGLELSGVLYSCGRAPADPIVLIVVARDAAGRVLDFADAPLDADAPLPPGGQGRIVVRWPSGPATVDPPSVTLTAFTLATQDVAPARVPCGPQVRRWLPRVAR